MDKADGIIAILYISLGSIRSLFTATKVTDSPALAI